MLLLPMIETKRSWILVSAGCMGLKETSRLGQVDWRCGSSHAGFGRKMVIFEAALCAWEVGFPVDNGAGEHFGTHGDDACVHGAIGMRGNRVCLVIHAAFDLDQSLQTSVESNADGATCGLGLSHMAMLVLVHLMEDVRSRLSVSGGVKGLISTHSFSIMVVFFISLQGQIVLLGAVM